MTTFSTFINHQILPLRPCALLVALAMANTAVAEGAYTLNPSVTTANRVAQTADASLAPVSVITRDDIVRSQADSLETLLQQQLGLSLAQSGGAGQPSSLFLRGSNANHVLVLMDGIKLGSATAGTTRFEQIPLAWIDRIEIVRGPRSSLYGSEAIGGVIQIFTRQGANTFTPSFSIGVGSEQTREWAGAVAGHVGEQGWYQAGFSQYATAGINACRLAAACYTVEPDRDGFRNASLNLRAGWRFVEGGQADINVARTQGQSDYDGTFQNKNRTAQTLIAAQWQLPLSSNWSSTWRIGQSRDLSENFLNGQTQGEINTQRDMLTWQNDFIFSPALAVTAGIDWLRDNVSGQTDYTISSRDNLAAFVRYRGEFAAHQIEASARQDDNQQFGKASTGSLSYGYALSQAFLLTASYSTAFKAPTFNDLYYPGYDNPNLQPEKSKSLELGLTHTLPSSSWSVHVFATNINNLIGLDSNYRAINVNEAQIRGVEWASQVNVQGWWLRGNVSLLNPKNTSSGVNAGKQLPRRAKQTINASFDKAFGLWQVGGDWHSESMRYDDAANNPERKMAGFGKIDLRGEYAINPTWRVQAKIGNVLDKTYETAYGYNQLGRTFMLTLRYDPK